jgi:hypothetical protein
MPVNFQSFTSKKSTWNKFISKNNKASTILTSLFENNEDIELSRNDLFFNFAENGDYETLVIAVILWGYPAGMRGNHFQRITDKLDEVVTLLKEANNGITDWDSHYNKTKPIKGLGLSTYTKFLYFIKAKVNSYPCVILDQRIIDSINKGFLSGFSTLNGIKTDNAQKKYPDYLKLIDDFSNKYSASHGQVEMFIFEYGLNLK